jgi:hypothetical protein
VKTSNYTREKKPKKALTLLSKSFFS